MLLLDRWSGFGGFVSMFFVVGVAMLLVVGVCFSREFDEFVAVGWLEWFWALLAVGLFGVILCRKGGVCLVSEVSLGRP